MQFISIKEHQSVFNNETFKDKFFDSEKEKWKTDNLESEIFHNNKYSSARNGIIPEAYYIGIDWLIENEIALIVNPKINHLDYLKMFMECFKHPTVSNEINKDRRKGENKELIYKINLNKKPIPLLKKNFEITPLLIIHFVKVLEKICICKRGLKKDYIRREENLSSKIKGKIVFANHLKKNTMMGRADRVYCNYQDYSVDCLENQVLKKALVFCQNYLGENLKEEQKNTFIEMNKTISFCKSFFAGVSDLRQAKFLKQFKVNKLYRDYTEALDLAKIILQRFGYNVQESIKKENETNKTPPFWINMALLFEMYVLAKLKDKYGSQIYYQFHGNYGDSDFLKIPNDENDENNEKIIIDAKYKDKYKDGYDIADIRQLSGYARDIKVLEKLFGKEKEKLQEEEKNTVIPCLIIYPNQCEIKEFTSDKLLEEEKNKIEHFTEFYKIGVKLPTLD